MYMYINFYVIPVPGFLSDEILAIHFASDYCNTMYM